MKILIIGQLDNPQLESKFFGGVERAERFQLEGLSDKHEVHFVTPKDSDMFENYPFAVFHLNDYSRKYYNKLPKKYYKKQFISLRNKVNEKEYDVIISNSKRSSFIRELRDIRNDNIIQIIHFLIFKYGLVGLGLAEELYKNKLAGHKLFTVSEYAIKNINESFKNSKFLKNRGLDITKNLVEDLVFPNIFSSNRSLLKEKYNYGGCLGRLSSEKNLIWTNKIFTENSITFYFNSPSSEKEIEYFNELINNSKGLISYKLDLPYKKLMEELGKLKFCFIPLNFESFGIVSFEAMERGTPVIVNRKKGSHANDTFLKDCPFYFPVDTDGLRIEGVKKLINEKIEKIDKMKKEDFQSIIDYSKKFSKEWFIKKIEECILLEKKETHEKQVKRYKLF